jgi:hypothetical protein
MMIANYQAQEAVDNDDGSGYYHTHHNVLVYGDYGQKADMADHDNWHHNNVYACVTDLPVLQLLFTLRGGSVRRVDIAFEADGCNRCTQKRVELQ